MVAHLVADELSRIFSVHEFEDLARERMPIEGYSFVAGWAGSGRAARANLDAFARWAFRPRVLVDVSRIDTSTTVLGRTIALPVLFAPTALHRFAHPDAELATARAAEALDTIMIISTGSSLPIEEIAPVAPSPWFQLYWFTDRGLTADLVARAEASGCAALCLTVDAPVPAWREGEMRLPPLPSPGIRAGNFPEIVDPPLQVDGSLTWRSLEWLRSITELPLVLKGVMTAEDAALALESGVDGIVVSNHGGRQLDFSMATLDALPEVVDAVAGRIDVLVDGGIRRGTDVLKALALGARAVLIGRPLLWGLGAGGTEGLLRMVELIRGELVSAMGHTGQTSASRIDSTILARVASAPPAGFSPGLSPPAGTSPALSR